MSALRFLNRISLDDYFLHILIYSSDSLGFGLLSLSWRRSEEIRRKLEVRSVCETIELYRIDCRDHVLRMADRCSAVTV
jgi:hypothetical protein